MLDISTIRSQFPSLNRSENGHDVIYLDGPGGTQVPRSVIEAVSGYYERSNANSHGYFPASKETDQVIHDARQAIAVLLNAPAADCISIGQNMTSLSYSLSRAFYRLFQAGDEVLITQLDHEANRGPWLTLRQKGVIVREVRLLESGNLDYDDLENKLCDRTRLVAIGAAANALGTVNDLSLVRELTYRYNAMMLVDAVHYAPHFTIDVQEMGCDFLLCSSYKFYGPHLGFLYSKPGLLDTLPTDRLITAGQKSPESIETGTLNHAALAGTTAAVEFLSSFGQGESLRDRLLNAYSALGEHENRIARKLYDGLLPIDGIVTHGLDFDRVQRAPTLAFTHRKFSAAAICKALGEKMIYCWDGHFYAIRAIQVLGLMERGGVTRMGISVYNTESDVEKTLETLRNLS